MTLDLDEIEKRLPRGWMRSKHDHDVQTLIDELRASRKVVACARDLLAWAPRLSSGGFRRATKETYVALAAIPDLMITLERGLQLPQNPFGKPPSSALKEEAKVQIAVITHVRCGEHTGKRTLVWVPEDWSKEVFRAAVARAQEAHLNEIKSFKDEAAPAGIIGGGRYPDYERYPTKWTILEVKQDHAKKQAAYKSWENGRLTALKTFESYLREQGMEPFWAIDFENELGGERVMTLDWDHHHHWPIQYSETLSEDIEGPLKRRADDGG